MFKTVLVVGSAPDALRAKEIDRRHLSAIVAINNAWRVRADWTHCVHAGDFPEDRRPIPTGEQSLVSHREYVPANNLYGGIVYAGATMAFSTAYWALAVLKPSLMAFCGCDMIYDRPSGPTHFYGRGSADPLRDDPTLQSLEAKSNRLLLIAASQGCLCANLSAAERSRLTFPRLQGGLSGSGLCERQQEMLRAVSANRDDDAMRSALVREAEAGNFIEDGDYWRHEARIDAAALAEIDGLWLASYREPPSVSVAVRKSKSQPSGACSTARL